MNLTAGGNVTLANDTARAGGAVRIAAGGSDPLRLQQVNAGGEVVLRQSGTGDIEVDHINGQGVTVEKSGTGKAEVQTVNAGGGQAMLRHNGTGNMWVHHLQAGSLAGSHNGSGDFVVDTAAIGGSGTAAHTGAGDIRFGTMQFGDSGYVNHTGRGDINIQNLTAGGRAWLINRHGGMNLGTIEGHRLLIADMDPNAEVRANILRAKNLITIFSLHQRIGLFDAPTILDLLLAGDQTRKAVGWETSADASDHLSAYRRRHDVLGLDGFIDLQPWEKAFSQRLPLVSLTVGDKDIDEEAYLTEVDL